MPVARPTLIAYHATRPKLVSHHRCRRSTSARCPSGRVAATVGLIPGEDRPDARAPKGAGPVSGPAPSCISPDVLARARVGGDGSPVGGAGVLELGEPVEP